jgi:hypothetical protein
LKSSVTTQRYIDYGVWHNNCQFCIKDTYVQIPVMPSLPSGKMQSGELFIKEGRAAENGFSASGFSLDILY